MPPAPAEDSGRRRLSDLELNETAGCGSPASPCVVVRVELANNGLKGTLGDHLGQLDHLADLDVSGNELTGPLPAFLWSRPWLRLAVAGNAFHYSGSADASSADPCAARSEEHTSELQSLAYLVCRLLLAGEIGRASCRERV